MVRHRFQFIVFLKALSIVLLFQFVPASLSKCFDPESQLVVWIQLVEEAALDGVSRLGT